MELPRKVEQRHERVADELQRLEAGIELRSGLPTSDGGSPRLNSGDDRERDLDVEVLGHSPMQ